jgi:thiol-disulfide isomerase/thioredoxin
MKYQRIGLLLALLMLGAVIESISQVAGQPAPAFKLPNLDGQIVSFPEDFRGRAVIIHFWATWCPVCRNLIPHLQEFYQVYGDQVVILGVDMLEEPNLVRQFVREFKMTYPVVLDREGVVTRLYKVVTTDTSYWVDPQGILRAAVPKGQLSAAELSMLAAGLLFQSDLVPLASEVKVLRALDRNGDGKPEAELLDADGDGRADGARLAVNSDGKSEATALLFKKAARGRAPLKSVTLEYATNSAGERLLQRLRVDLNHNGNPEITLIDSNLDDKIDQIMVDIDDDGKPDLTAP